LAENQGSPSTDRALYFPSDTAKPNKIRSVLPSYTLFGYSKPTSTLPSTYPLVIIQVFSAPIDSPRSRLEYLLDRM
jgi:hypothetical protein